MPNDDIAGSEVGSENHSAPSDRSRFSIDRDQAVERWLRNDVLEGHAEYLWDPSCAVPAADLLDHIKGRRAKPVRK